MTAPQPGDEVRVVITGTVNTDWSKLESLIASVGGNVDSLEVLPKPCQIGDVLNSSDAYVRAPVGSVAKDETSGVLLFKRSTNHWVDSTDQGWYVWELHGNRTIVFLP